MLFNKATDADLSTKAIVHSFMFFNKAVLLGSILLNKAIIQCVSKKGLVFEIQISHNYSDLIVLKCVELMIRDKNVSYSQKRSIGHVPLRENLLFYDSLNESMQLYLSGKFNRL